MKFTAFDCETWLIQDGNLAPRLVCITTFDGEEERIWKPQEGLDYIEAALEDESITLIGQNVAYDVGIVCEARPHLIDVVFREYEAGRIRDTHIRQRLIDLADGELEWDRFNRKRKYGLADLVMRHFGENIFADKKGEDAWRLRYHELDGVPLESWPEKAVSYALEDAVWAYKVHMHQWRAGAGLPFKNEGFGIVNEIEQTRQAWALHLMSCWGLRTDGDAIAALKAAMREKMRAVKAMMKREGAVVDGEFQTLMRPDGTRNRKALQQRVSDAYDGSPPMTEKSKRASESWTPSVSTAGDVCKESGDEVLEAYGWSKVPEFHLNTTIPALEKGVRHPMQPRYYVVKETGRTSSRSPNMQNFSRKGGFRECVVARPGTVLIAADYSQIELVAFAYVQERLFGSSALADAINEGRDCHLMVVSQLLGLPYAALSKAKHKNVRDFAKEANYGFPGGMGARTFKKRLRKRFWKGDISEEIANKTLPECQHIRDVWMETWPEVSDYFDHINTLVGEHGTGSLIQFGSQRKRGRPSFTQACNSFFQGLTADGMSDAIWAVSRECYLPSDSPLYGCRAVGAIHDEILLEAPEEIAPEAAERLSEVMRSCMQRWMPSVKVSVEPALMRRWSKMAETVRDSQGRLCVWEPKEEEGRDAA